MHEESKLKLIASEPESLKLGEDYYNDNKQEIFNAWLNAYLKGVDISKEYSSNARKHIPKSLALMAVTDFVEFHKYHVKGEE